MILAGELTLREFATSCPTQSNSNSIYALNQPMQSRSVAALVWHTHCTSHMLVQCQAYTMRTRRSTTYVRMLAQKLDDYMQTPYNLTPNLANARQSRVPTL